MSRWLLVASLGLPGALLAGGAAAADPKVRGFPLALVADVPLPGRASRFDYQDVDPARGHLFVAHMGDDEVIVVALADGATVKRIPGIRTVRGIRVAAGANLVLATAATDELVRIDATSLAEVGRARTGRAPDGVDWDPVDRVVGVSDQRDGALSLLPGDGAGARRQVRVGTETGNVAFDRGRRRFWVTAVQGSPPDLLVALDPTTGAIEERIPLPGCEGAHGLRLHPDGLSALVACEGNDVLARVELSGPHRVVTAPVGRGPDVLALDPGLARLYVAAESGQLAAFDLGRPGLVSLGLDRVGANAHTVAVDPATHRLFLPLPRGSGGGPVLRIMRPVDR